MALKVKELTNKKPYMTPGHRACAGCGSASVLRICMLAAQSLEEYEYVVGISTGCMEVTTTIYPYTAWNVPFIHNAFENVAATISGVETAFQRLYEKGKVKKKFKFIAFGGDGGTYDIGLQALSGAMERGHDMVYICYNNEAYMNTGIQRSSATPFCAATSTSPAGSKIPGKPEQRKELTEIMVAHNLPYLAQASLSHYRDLMKKVQTAITTEGPTFINVLSSCFRGWRMPMEQGVSSTQKAVDACFWPLYEVKEGEYKLNYKPKEKLPITEMLKGQGRFKHLLAPENEHLLQQAQAYVDKKWEEILWKSGEKSCDS